MPDTAMSIAASNAVIHLRREYLIIGDPMWLDAWGGRVPPQLINYPWSPLYLNNGVKCSLWVQVLGYAIYKNDLSGVFIYSPCRNCGIRWLP